MPRFEDIESGIILEGGGGVVAGIMITEVLHHFMIEC